MSPVEIFCRRFDARGDIDINIGLPESSVRGFWIAWAGFARGISADVARFLRGIRCADENSLIEIDIGLWVLRRVDGARKSRYSDCEVAPEVALL